MTVRAAFVMEFGASIYEIGNMDHSIMQGVQAVDRTLLGEEEEEEEEVWRPVSSAPLRKPLAAA